MSLERRLSEELIRRHPERAAAALERLPSDEAVALLARLEPRGTAAVVQRLSPHFAAEVLAGGETPAMAEVLAALPLDVASRLLRRLPDDTRAALLAGLDDARLARSLRSLLRFAEGSAGALMDPMVLALPEDLTAAEALERVRETPESARYNLYVVDRQQRLVGALNLRELMLAAPRERLSQLMVREPLQVPASADRSLVVAHPGWREVHALPVVDEQGGYLGALRYRTLRDLEEELLESEGRDSDAPEALGRLFSIGAGGLLDALSGAAAARPEER